MNTETKARRFGDILHDFHLCPVIPNSIDVEPFGRRFDIGRNTVDQRILAALRTVDPFETLRWISAREGTQVMGNRVEIAVRPETDPCEASAGVEVHRVSASTHLGRQQQNPITEASAAEIGLGIDQLALDVMALGLGIGVAGMPGAVCRYDLVLDDRIAERGGLADRCGAGDHGQEIASIDFRGFCPDLVCRLRMSLRSRGFARLCLLVLQKFVVVLL